MGTLRPGDVVCDRFRLERLAGSGGMGAVFLAHDLRGTAPVALKVFTGTRAADAERFEREARVLADLRHPGIVRYVAHGATEDGERWLAMEWLEGETLNDFLRGGRALDVETTLEIVARVADALGFAHERGVVHRDIKPSNLFLVGGSPQGVRVLDFGVAHLRRASVQLTQTGAPIGTPGYMAPEQARGARNVDARADVFALGCILYRCLTGKRAFPGSDVMAVLTKVLLEEVPRVSATCEVPRALDDLVARMLTKDANHRPVDAAAVADELRAIGDKTATPKSSLRSSLRASRSAMRALGDAERRVLVMLMARSSKPTMNADLQTAPGYGTPSPQDELRAIAERFGATMELLADGSILVVFDPKGEATDQAARAARCALALRPSLAPSPVVVAAGRGEVEGGVRTGEAIDRAVELLARAPHGQVLLDDSIGALLDARFDVAPSPEGAVLRGERDVGEMFRTVLGRRTDCVGRARELGTLEVLLRECMEESVARAALVIGPAGIGKSRLRQELVQHVRERTPDVELWVGRGDPMRIGSPFGLIAPALRRAAGIQDGEPIERRCQKLVARVERCIAAPEVQRVAEFLGEMIGVHFEDARSTQLRAARSDAALMGDQMLRAWLDFVGAECARTPLMIVLDDVHWGDLPSVRFVDAALRTLGDHRLMVLALARPEVHDVFPRLWSERDVQEIRLSELTKRACETLVKQVLGDRVDGDGIARIVERAAGNAFYLEELIRASAQGADAELPGSVLAMVQARLEALSQGARRLLRAASVFGETFRMPGVVALMGPEEDASQVFEFVGELVERELVVPRADAKSAEDREYRFRHALVRDAAYAMLTDEDRRIGHRLAAEWLVATGETDAIVLAEHLERGGEPMRAIHWYCAATEQALEANDFAAVIERGERAIRCGAKGDVHGAVRAMQTEAHRWRGELAEAERCSEEAMSALPVGSARWARAAAEAALASGPLGHHPRLTAIGEALLSSSNGLTRVTREPMLHSVAAARVSLQLMHAANFALADRLLEKMVRLDDAEAVGNPLGAGHALRARAVRALYAGDPETSLRHVMSSRAAFLRAGDVRTASVVAVDIGFNYMQLGAWSEAEGMLREALAEGERLGLRNVQGFALNNLPVPLLHQGRIDEAIAFGRRAIDLFAAQGDRRFEGGSHIYLADALLQRGALDEAEGEARRGVELADTSPPMQLQAFAVLAAVLLAAGRVDEAFGASSSGYAILQTLGSVDEGDSLVRLVHAQTSHARGATDEARAVLAEALRRMRARAARIVDPRLRATFAAIPENARIEALAIEWGVR